MKQKTAQHYVLAVLEKFMPQEGTKCSVVKK